MGATNLTTKDYRILNVDIVFRILTERIDYFLGKGIKNEYINEFRIIKNNCKIKLGNSKIVIDVKNENNVNLVTNSIVKIFNNTYLYNRLNDSFNQNIDARVVIDKKLKKSKTLKTIRLTSSGFSVEISIISQDSPLKGLPVLLKPGGANEAFLEILILEQFETLRELESEYGSIFPGAFKNPKLFLRLGISSTALYTTIGPILSASTVGGVRVGGLQQKPDVEIRTQNKVFKFSIKQNIFPEWSSAMNYQGAKAIIDYMQANNTLKISNNGNFILGGVVYNSLAFPATIGEIKKFCFNDDEIDFIIINTFNSNDIISNLIKADNNKYYIDVKCDAIYSNSMKGYRNLKNNVYLVISKSNSKSSKLMPGYRISFVPENKLRGAHIINDSFDIPDRL